MKRIIISIVSFVLIFTLFGCTANSKYEETEPTLSDEEISLQQQEIIKIGFSATDDEDVIEKTLSIEELRAWENPYSKYSSYILFDTLTEDEKLVYHALEYAMVNCYNYTFIDNRIKVSPKRADEIAELLSLDTPLLEQNLSHFAYSQAAFYDYQYSETRTVKVLHRSTTIKIKNFKKDLWDKKMLALKEAEKVIAQMDMTQSEVELAEEIYRYIAEGVTYIPYENEMGYYKGHLMPFLYDALIKKESHCDGFTNALALLYAMAGFEQVEKHNITTLGHTWNFVKIEGQWYNIDGTFQDLIPESSATMGGGVGFAFSDALQSAPDDLQELYPKSTSSYYLKPDGYTESCDSDNFLDILLEGFEKHDGEWALVIVDEYNKEAATDALNDIAYTYYTSMLCVMLEICDNKNAILYFRTDIM
ncbi:MAG: hypothetical protein E7532_05310 [Ruminococcaceae bacterium]|nr:hypothetical protein [Oscillospiraceae bacterium]